MEELKIKLDYYPDHFKEIYYRNGQGNVFTNKETRNIIFLLLLLILITVIIYVLSFMFSNISWMIVWGLIAVFGTGVVGTISIIKYSKWKRGIETYFKELSKYKSFNLLVNSSTIELSLDSKVTIDKWDAIKSAVIEDDYILLYFQNESYLFPAKSMSPDQFEKIKEFTKLRIRE